MESAGRLRLRGERVWRTPLYKAEFIVATRGDEEDEMREFVAYIALFIVIWGLWTFVLDMVHNDKDETE